jgi:hypothetical protein
MNSKSKRVAMTAAALVLTLVFAVPSLIRAGESDLRTEFSMNHNFTVPGEVLNANTKYVIMVGDAHTGMRRVVRIFNEDESKLITTFLAINDENIEPADETTFTFVETAPGYPKVVRSWFYPGRSIGMEFVYPKDQAMEIAQHSTEGLLATTATEFKDQDLDSIQVETVEPSESVAQSSSNLDNDATLPPAVAEEEQLRPDNTVAPRRDQNTGAIADSEGLANENQSIAQNDLKTEPEVLRNKPTEQDTTLTAQNTAPATRASEQPQTSANTSSELPQTAGELPLIGMIGALLLSLGFAVRVFTNR